MDPLDGLPLADADDSDAPARTPARRQLPIDLVNESAVALVDSQGDTIVAETLGATSVRGPGRRMQ